MSKPHPIFRLQELLNSQDNVGTQTPLFCVICRDNPDDPEDGTGEIRSMFLTEEAV